MSDPPDPKAPSAAAVLIVDDNRAKRLSIRAVLEPLELQIVEAGSGELALHAVMERTFAVILMDVQMPEMDGYETARFIRMRAESETTPIIFITAHTGDEVQIPIAYQSGAVDFILGTIVPEILRAKVAIFTELFLKSRELEDREAHTRAVLNNVADGIVTVDDAGLIESFNRAASELFGYGEQEALGRPLSIMIVAEPDEQGDGPLQVPLTSATGATSSVGRRKDGSIFPVELDLSELQLGARRIKIGCVRDVSERQSYTEALRHQALHDDLTGLPNRVLFGDRVDHSIRRGTREGEPRAVVLLDLDEFKQVNDTLGHRHGDLLLKLVAERLVACLRDEDTVARLGGDEFAILPGGATDVAAAATVAWKVQQALDPPYFIEGEEIAISASLGVALSPEHGDCIDHLLRRADLAMYEAKRARSGYAVFSLEHEEEPARRLALLRDLRHCVGNGELVLHYQPKVDLTSMRTTGVEALIRWNHPSGRLMQPGEFMPEVEKNELMIPITKWVIGEALHQLRDWRNDGYDISMAINLGARCLAEGTGLFERADELTDVLGIPADKLTFELTESALIDTAVPGLMAQLEEMDERLSIDDFGTGYSSLVYLQRLPVVEIKADRSFVSTMATVKDDAVIVRSIIELAKNLSLQVVAEGVEDAETLEMLVAGGCGTAQGYYFSRPVPGAEVSGWLETSEFGAARTLVSSGEPSVPAAGIKRPVAEPAALAAPTQAPARSPKARPPEAEPPTRDEPVEADNWDVLWLDRLRPALTENRFVLFAQPIVNAVTEETVQHELLIRLLGKNGDLIAPAEFLPTAERFGLISEVDRWVLGEAAALAARGQRIAMNLSAGSLGDPDLGACVERELVAAGAPPELVGFEISETDLDNDRALATAFCESVRSLGCQVSLSDVGTDRDGSASEGLAVDSLKIGRNVISELLTGSTSEGVVSHIVERAGERGLSTVAEGVEDLPTLKRLQILGVSHVQGFYFARPAPAAEMLSGSGAVASGSAAGPLALSASGE